MGRRAPTKRDIRMVVTFGAPLHAIVDWFFKIVIALMIVRILLSWLQLSPSNRFVRFFSNVVDPVVNPIARRMPRMAMGMFDIGYTVAFIFMAWALLQIDAYILYALPAGW
jgi:uncharacterized protein YggT (Ycf19 family)